MRSQTLRRTPPNSHRVLQDDRDEELFTRYQRDGDLAARDSLVEQFMPLARRLARRYADRNEPLEDLVQVASLGLVKAIDRFEPERGGSFSSFAVPTILGELKRYFRDSSWSLHVPRRTQENLLEVTRAMDFLSSASGRSPSVEQLSSYLKMPREEVIAAMEAGVAYDTTSLDAPRGTSDEGATSLADSFGEVDCHYELVDETLCLRGTLRAMSQRERSILYLRFAGDLTQTEIAERIGISQMHVSRLIRRALDRLRVAAGVARPAGKSDSRRSRCEIPPAP